MYRIAAIADGENVFIEIGSEIDIGKFLFWLKANDYQIVDVQKDHGKISNSTVGIWLIEEFKKEEKFKGE